MRIPEPTRGAPLAITVDGETVPGFAGETVAAVMIAAERTAFRRDRQGRPRGLYCNMGTCCECMVTLHRADGPVSLRACLLPAMDGQRITTGLVPA
jgi:sarcosine oxidase subunit alpha